MDWQFWALIASLIVSVIAIIGSIHKAIGTIAKKYRKPFEELHARVDALDKHRPECDERFLELESIKGLEKTVAKHAEYLENDHASIRQNRRDNNSQADALDDLYDIVGDLTEGIHLAMQHDVKGNHTALLEEWMRNNASKSIKRRKNDEED